MYMHMPCFMGHFIDQELHVTSYMDHGMHVNIMVYMGHVV